MEEPKYYLDNGMVVFTESFLKDRGFCCNNGCRHCPYPKTNKHEKHNQRPIRNPKSRQAEPKLRQGDTDSRDENTTA